MTDKPVTPWAEYLHARAKAIDYLYAQGDTDGQIAAALSMDRRQVERVRTRDRTMEQFRVDPWNSLPVAAYELDDDRSGPFLTKHFHEAWGDRGKKELVYRGDVKKLFVTSD